MSLINKSLMKKSFIEGYKGIKDFFLLSPTKAFNIKNEKQRLTGIKGWLIFIFVPLVTGPLAILIGIITRWIFFIFERNNNLNPQNPLPISILGFILAGILVFNLVLMLNKRKLFPIVYIITQIFIMILSLITNFSSYNLLVYSGSILLSLFIIIKSQRIKYNFFN